MADPCPSSTTLAVAGSSLSEDSALGPERSLVGSTSEGASDTKTCLEPQGNVGCHRCAVRIALLFSISWNIGATHAAEQIKLI